MAEKRRKFDTDFRECAGRLVRETGAAVGRPRQAGIQPSAVASAMTAPSGITASGACCSTYKRPFMGPLACRGTRPAGNPGSESRRPKVS